LGNILADDETGVSVTLSTLHSFELALEPTPKIIALYSRPFHLTYVVTLAEWQLTTKLIIKNTSSRQGENSEEFLEFQALFHNYIRAPAAQVVVTPLQDLSFYDKTESSEAARTAPKKETRIGVDVTKFTDSVYVEAPQRYHVTWPGGGIALRTKDLKDVVIWNPQSELGGKLRDMEDAGWYNHSLTCTSPARIGSNMSPQGKVHLR
jgi:glucose-6-phosphate 1-epimerase